MFISKKANKMDVFNKLTKEHFAHYKQWKTSIDTVLSTTSQKSIETDNIWGNFISFCKQIFKPNV